MISLLGNTPEALKQNRLQSQITKRYHQVLQSARMQGSSDLVAIFFAFILSEAHERSDHICVGIHNKLTEEITFHGGDGIVVVNNSLRVAQDAFQFFTALIQNSFGNEVVCE